MLATIENMEQAAATRSEHKAYLPVTSFSPTTGERYSADPRDYFWAPPGWLMKDENGDPMILVVIEERVREL